jgi:hypothetical protein
LTRSRGSASPTNGESSRTTPRGEKRSKPTLKVLGTSRGSFGCPRAFGCTHGPGRPKSRFHPVSGLATWCIKRRQTRSRQR